MEARQLTALTALCGGVLVCALALGSCSQEVGEPTYATSSHTELRLLEDGGVDPFMTRVIEYRPAPGQFVGETPKYIPGDTEEDMRHKAEKILLAQNPKDTLVALGSWGGYIVVGFDHTIPNLDGEDLWIGGNAFDTSLAKGIAYRCGSSEPGVVYVAKDKNQNGRPDEDEWCELSGPEEAEIDWIDEFGRRGGSGLGLPDYEVTYERPTYIPDPSYFDRRPIYHNYLHWTAIDGREGWIDRNTWHQEHSYYPEWIKEDKITFRGRLLPDNHVFDPEGKVYVGLMYPYGYVDNVPNDDWGSLFDIDRAVTRDGSSANLTGIDFIKVQTGTLETAGNTGNISTELSGAADLHELRRRGIPITRDLRRTVLTRTPSR